MPNIKILDCTLRDGGYINDFQFGEAGIESIIRNLSQSAVDIIECGFLQSGKDDPNKSLFAKVKQIKPFLKNRVDNLLYVAMIALGDITSDEIEPCDGTSITGIRVTFHEHEIDQAFLFGQDLQGKGYQVFMQPVGTTSYQDAALLKLVERVNQMRPYAFYLVDTLGTMYKNDLMRMFHLVDHNLAEGIAIGYHSHNNLQLAFSNAQELLQINSKREIILDSSVFGMGRGAGNLCTELITQYINDNVAKRYDVIPLLEIVDNHLNAIFTETPWGYSVPYFIASSHHCHPNYATFLLNKQTISVKDIHQILLRMDDAKRNLFDRDYINSLYLEYQTRNHDDSETVRSLADQVTGQTVLVIAPGRSIDIYRDRINLLTVNKQVIVATVNFLPSFIHSNLLFISNQKRFHNIGNLDEIANQADKLIITSNLSTELKTVHAKNIMIANYVNYLNQDPAIADNAGLMLLNLLVACGAKSIHLAGFDGFNVNEGHDYAEESTFNTLKSEDMIKRNEATAKRIGEISQKVEINFVTPSVYGK